MDEGEKILQHRGLIYLAIKKEKLYWKTEDEYQEYVDAGYDGLLKGIRAYDESKGIKESTYYYACIKHEMYKVIYKKNLTKNKAKVVSLNTIVQDAEDTELIDLIPSTVDVEQEVFDIIRNERLIELIDHLPIEKDRYVIKMLYGLDGFKELNASEIARRWNVNKNAIIHRRNRALRQLWYRIRNEGL